jgi:hypothetical protein
VITHSIPASLAGTSAKVTCELSWDPKCPVMVNATFTPRGEEPVYWMWSLDLLRVGARMVMPYLYGVGDVRITTDGAGVLILLRSPEGTAVITLDYAATVAFRDEVTLANLTEEASMLALVDEFLVQMSEEAF